MVNEQEHQRRRSAWSGGRVPAPAANQTVQVEAVIDALPSPTVLLAPDGTVLLANSAWTARNAAEGSPVALGVGGNYFETALRLFAADTVRTVVEALGELSRGERETV